LNLMEVRRMTPAVLPVKSLLTFVAE